jgi:hypothetical protein
VEQPDGNAGELDDADVAVDPAGVLGRFDVPDRRADDPVPREGVDGLGERGIGGDLHELVAGEGVREGRDGDAVEAAVEPVAAAELALLVEAVPDVLHAHAQLRLGAPRPRARLRLRPLLLPRTRRLHGSLPPSPFFLSSLSTYHTDASLFSTSTSALLFLVSVRFNTTPCFARADLRLVLASRARLNERPSRCFAARQLS